MVYTPQLVTALVILTILFQGNKGATAVRLTFIPPINANDTPDVPSTNVKQSQDNAENEDKASALTLTFVNAHLAAFDEMVDRRNQDFHELSRKLTFGRDFSEPTENVAYEEDFGAQLNPLPDVSIYQTDALFWMVSSTQ
jgi:phosphatidylinositol-bisphosphatase